MLNNNVPAIAVIAAEAELWCYSRSEIVINTFYSYIGAIYGKTNRLSATQYCHHSRSTELSAQQRHCGFRRNLQLDYPPQ